MVSATLKTADQIKPENWLGWSFMTFNHTWPSPYSLCTHFWLFGLSQTNNLLRIHSRKSNMTEIHHSAGLEEASLKIAALKRVYYTMLRTQSNLTVMFGEGKGEMISLCYSRTFPKGTEIAATWNLVIMHWKKLLHCSSVFWFTPTGNAVLCSREDRVPAAPRAPALLNGRSPPAGLVSHHSALSFPVLLQPAHRPGKTHWGTE